MPESSLDISELRAGVSVSIIGTEIVTYEDVHWPTILSENLFLFLTYILSKKWLAIQKVPMAYGTLKLALPELRRLQIQLVEQYFKMAKLYI